MTSLYLLFWFTFIVAVACSPLADTNSTVLQKRAVSQQVFDDLVFYFQYASSVYNDVCSQPNGNTMVQRINQLFTDTQGFIVRDDGRKEIVVALRDSTSPTDFLLDNELFLVPFITPGVSPPLGSLVHTGFVTAWNSIALQVISTVRSQLNAHPGYSLVTTGHSLGGSLSSLAAISLKQNFPKVPIKMYTYGQPRTFNAISRQFSIWYKCVPVRSYHRRSGKFDFYGPRLLPPWRRVLAKPRPSNSRQCQAVLNHQWRRSYLLSVHSVPWHRSFAFDVLRHRCWDRVLYCWTLNTALNL